MKRIFLILGWVFLIVACGLCLSLVGRFDAAWANVLVAAAGLNLFWYAQLLVHRAMGWRLVKQEKQG